MLTSKQVARRIGQSEWWVRSMRKKVGVGPPHYIIGRKVLYSAEEVSAWLAARRRT